MNWLLDKGVDKETISEYDSKRGPTSHTNKPPLRRNIMSENQNVVRENVNSAVESIVSVASPAPAVKVRGRPGRPRVAGSNLSRARAEFESNPNRPRAEIIKAFTEVLGIPKPTANTYYQVLKTSIRR